MVKEKKIPIGSLNVDDDPRYLQADEYINMENCRSSAGSNSNELRIENILGTILKFNGYPTGIGIQGNHEIGWVLWEEKNRLIWFVANENTLDSDLSRIYCHDYATGTTWTVMQGGNFNRKKRIHSAFIENGLLYWVNDDQNEPRRINIEAAINLYQPGTFPNVVPYAAMNDDIRAWVRRQPSLPLTAVKVNQTSPALSNNFIKDEAFLYTWRYQYRDFEFSCIADFSALVNYNLGTDVFNAIDITAPLLEPINDDVQKIELIALYLNTNTGFIIKRWDKNIPADATAIANHNTGTALTYRHYNDTKGIAVGSSVMTKQFDPVALTAGTCELAKDRSFMGQILAGYDTPTLTSLVVSAGTISPDTLIAEWVGVNFFSPISGSLGNHSYIHIAGYGYYDVTPQPPGGPPPSTEPFSNLTLVSVDDTTVFNNYIKSIAPGPIPPNEYFIFYDVAPVTITGGPTPPTAVGTKIFKTAAYYQVSVNFKDRAGRRCGYLTTPSSKVEIPEKVYNTSIFTTSIFWTLSNANAINEIPVFADEVSINISLCQRTRFFEQLRGTKGASYAAKDSTGNWVLGGTGVVTDTLGCAFEISALNFYTMGYVFQEGRGDIIKIYLSDSSPVRELKIVSQLGNYVITEFSFFAAGLTSTTQFLFEIYTPYQPVANEPHYQVAQCFKISNPGTAGRAYSVLSGQLNGDVTLVQRNDGTSNYLAEAMSPNDNFYTRWNTDAGKNTFIDTIGQVQKDDFFVWSNTIIEGTQINGLSTFDALDSKSVPLECGAIQKLKLTSKVHNEMGGIMLAICKFETVSLYLGETQILDANKQAQLGTTTEVVGSMNVLKGSNGTINPESVFGIYGRVWWLDAFNGGIARYADNGLFMSSDFKMKRFFRRWCKRYMEQGRDAIDTLNGFSHVSICVDPDSDRLLIALPATEAQGYCGTLPGYSAIPSYTTSVDNRYDFYDGKAKMVAFKYKQDKWGEAYTYVPTLMAYLGTTLYGWKNGLWKFGDPAANSYNTVFGLEQPQRICLAINQNMDVIREMQMIGIEGNSVPNFTHIMTTYPNVQSSDLSAADYKTREGISYAAFYRDMLSPNTAGTITDKLYKGDKVRAQVVYLMLEFSEFNKQLIINFINVGYRVSSGHAPILTTQ